MHPDLVPGRGFPDIRLPEHTGRELSISEIARGQPLLLCFVRGWWCPKEQVRAKLLVSIQDEVQREYGKLCAVTVDEPYVNGAFRAGIGADFPWLADVDRRVASELDLLETTDRKHRPYLPYTFALDSLLRIHRVWCGFWYWGNPTPDELRLALREITRAEQPTFDPQAVWSGGGSAAPERGIAGERIWIREDPDGNEIQRGVHAGEPPAVGDELGTGVDGRPWVVHELEESDGRVAIHLRKPPVAGDQGRGTQVGHHITVPR